MYFCFLIEEQYRNEYMPMAVARKLKQWGHHVDLLEPQATITCLSDLSSARYDAMILKTVSNGPGISLLEAAEAAGIPTINSSRSIRLVRDKAVATTLASARGIPMPRTYFVAHPQLLAQIPLDAYPLVVKPTDGSSCRGIYKINHPSELGALQLIEAESSFLLAQHYEENVGYDIKLYVIGKEVFAVAKRSPLHPEVKVHKQPIAIASSLRELALQVGRHFGLDIYGLDIVETLSGPRVVDINDFPSFGQVPHATQRLANYIVHIARRRVHERIGKSEPIATAV